MSDPIVIMTCGEMYKLMLKALKLEDDIPNITYFKVTISAANPTLEFYRQDESGDVVDLQTRAVTKEMQRHLDFLKPENLISELVIVGFGGASAPVRCHYTRYIDSAFTKHFLNFLNNL